MISAPSLVTRRPASDLSRSFAAGSSDSVPARSNLSCTAVATLLTFCPPGPEARTKDQVKSRSGSERLLLIATGMGEESAPSGVEVGDALALEASDLVLQQQLAFLQPFELQLVHVHVERQAGDH